ncbi:MAG: hypothetical protein ACLRP9_06350 [Anaerovoracaceae bacterium]
MKRRSRIVMCWITAIIMAFAMVVPMSVSAVEMSGAEDYSSISDVQNSEQNIKQSIEENKTSIENTESVNDKGEKVEINTRNADAVIMVQGENSKGYVSINEALADVGDYVYATNRDEYVITLQKDIQEDIIIPPNKRITIDLNGHKITNVNSHTIVNNSTRINIIDSSADKTGVIDNVTHGKGAIYNNINANITLKGGTYMRSEEASTSSSDSGGNSWYVLKNFGTMTIKDGVTVKFSDENTGMYSSLIGNGWQNSAAAENGSNSEPKPSDGKKKASLTINGGVFSGGQITVKNDDYGVLTVTGGTIDQVNNGRYAIYNANDATISGGTIKALNNGVAVGNAHYDGNANIGKLTISNGEFISDGNVVDGNAGVNISITGGSFTTKSENGKILSVDDNSTVAVSGGTYHGIKDLNSFSNKEDVFKEGYGLESKTDDTFGVDITDEAAEGIVIDVNGNEKKYLTFESAVESAPAGSTVKLLKDITTDKNITTKHFGITVDLNGFNIDGTALGSKDSVITLKTQYNSKPVEGIENTIKLINNKETGGEIKGTLPVSAKAGDSKIDLPIEISENVKLTVIGDGDAVKLESSAYMSYNERTKDFISNGGFKVTADNNEQRLYGNYSNAVKYASDGVVTLLNNYTGSNTIASGSVSGILDLGEHTYTYTGKNALVDVNSNDVTLTIRNGKLVATDKESSGAELVGGNNDKNNRGLVLNSVEMTVPGEVYGIVTNGTETGNSITLINSVLNVKEGFGIYFPSDGDVKIDNSIINAKYVGVQVCAGNLTITGDQTQINTTGTPQEKIEGDGVISDGSAISIIERDGYKDLGTISIENGTFTSSTGVDAIKAYKYNNTDKESEWAEAGDVVSVIGGNFSSKVPEEICGEQFAPTEMDPETGMFTVVKDTEAPVIIVTETEKPLVDGTYYGGHLEFSVSDDRLKTVTLNGTEIQLDENGVYNIDVAGDYTLVTEDTVGNITEVKFTLKADKGIISQSTTSVKLTNELTANGTEQTQLIEVVVGGVILTEDVDYSVTGNTATEAGTYTLTIKGIDNYEGEVSVQYTVSEQQGTTEEPGGTTGDNQGEDQNNKNDSSAKTGDDFNAAPLIALMGITAAAAAGTAFYGRRKNEGR